MYIFVFFNSKKRRGKHVQSDSVRDEWVVGASELLRLCDGGSRFILPRLGQPTGQAAASAHPDPRVFGSRTSGFGASGLDGFTTTWGRSRLWQQQQRLDQRLSFVVAHPIPLYSQRRRRCHLDTQARVPWPCRNTHPSRPRLRLLSLSTSRGSGLLIRERNMAQTLVWNKVVD